jgi:hypothetical protein
VQNWNPTCDKFGHIQSLSCINSPCLDVSCLASHNGYAKKDYPIVRISFHICASC